MAGNDQLFAPSLAIVAPRRRFRIPSGFYSLIVARASKRRDVISMFRLGVICLFADEFAKTNSHPEQPSAFGVRFRSVIGSEQHSVYERLSRLASRLSLRKHCVNNVRRPCVLLFMCLYVRRWRSRQGGWADLPGTTMPRPAGSQWSSSRSSTEENGRHGLERHFGTTITAAL